MCPKCYEMPCLCVSSSKASQPLWLTKHCATTGCNTTIRWMYTQTMGEAICKWCQKKEDAVEVDQ